MRLSFLATVTLLLAFDGAARPLPERAITGLVYSDQQDARVCVRVTLRRHFTNYEALRQRLGANAPDLSHVQITLESNGRFHFPIPAPGLYQVEITAQGFVPVLYRPIPVTGTVHLPPVKLVEDDGFHIEIVSDVPLPAETRIEAVATQHDFWARVGGGADGWEPAPRFSLSDPSGKLTFPRAPGEQITLRLFLPKNPEPLSSNTDGTSRWILAVPTSVERRLRVVDEQGTGLPGIVVTAGRSLWPVGYTDSQGTLTMDAGDLDSSIPLRIFAPGDQILDAELARGEADVTLVLPRPARLEGRVVDEHEAPIAGALTWQSFDPGAFAVTDEQGHFSLPARTVVSNGRGLLVQAEASRHLPNALVIGRNGGAAQRIELRLPLASAIVGQVLDVQGNLLGNVEVTASPLRFYSKRILRLDRAADRATTDAEGRFALRRLESESGYMIQARCPGFLPAQVVVGRLRVDQVRVDVQLVLEKSRGLRGQVVDPWGEALVGVEIRLDPPRSARKIEDVTATTGADGRFEIPEIPWPRFHLGARKSGYARFWLRNVEVPDSASVHNFGTLTLEPASAIRGTVTDPDGRAVSGVQVWMLDRLESPAWDLLPRIDRMPAATKTDAEGHFEISGLNRGRRISLVFRHPDHLPATVEAVEAPTPSPMEIVLKTGTRVRGRVVDPDGEPVADARVNLSAAGSMIGATELPLLGAEHRRSTTSRDDGSFALAGVPVGELRLEAFKDGLLSSEPLYFETRDGEEVSGMILVLTPGAVLEGRVLTDGHEPVARARVSALPTVGFTDAKGAYRLEGVAPGPVTVEIRHSIYRGIDRELVIQAGVHHLDVIMQRGIQVIGRVVDSQNRPVNDAAVVLTSTAYRDPRRFYAFTDVEGLFRFEEVAEGEYAFKGRKEGFAPAEETIRVHRDHSGEVVLRMQREVVLTGRAVGLEADELASLQIEAHHETLRSKPARIDFEGRYIVTGLAPGDWRLEAATRDRRRQLEARVVLPVGRDRVERDLEFGNGHILSGQVTWRGKPLQGAKVALRSRGAAVRPKTITRHNGRFEVTDLPLGPYRIEITHPRQALLYNHDMVLDADREVWIEISASVVSGYVVSASDGLPIPDAMIYLEQLHGGDDGSLYAFPTNTEGFFAFPRISDGTYRLSVRKDGYAMIEEVLAVSPDLEPMRLELERTSGLELWPRHAWNVALSHVTATVLDADGSLVLTESRPIEDGRAKFPTVPPGTWRLLVKAPESAVVELKVEVPGDPILVRLPPASRLRLRIPALIETNRLALARVIHGNGRPLRGLDDYGVPLSAWKVAGGLAVVEGVPAGSWVVQVATDYGELWSGSFESAGEPEIQLEVR